MRILTVSAFFESHGGGIEIAAGALARALADLGHDSRITGAAFDPASQRGAAVPVALAGHDPLEKLIGLPMPLPSAAARTKLRMEVRAADAVIVHDALYASSLLAARLARRYRKPWLLVQHIGAIPYTNPLLRGAMRLANRLITQRMLGSAPQAIFISDLVRRHFARVHYERPPALIFNGIERGLFKIPTEDERIGLRQQFGLSIDRRHLLFVGRFVEKKGLTALRSFAALRADLDLLIVGSGPLDPVEWGLANVRVLGRRSREDLASLYRACDALVLPSVGEGYPLVVQEALASGMPVYCGLDSVAADPSAARFLHPIDVVPHDPVLTALRLSEAIGDAPPRRNPHAAAYAARAYDWRTNATTVTAILRELIA